MDLPPRKWTRAGRGRRIAGAILMVLGIGFVALVTAAIAAHFVEEEEQDLVAEVRRIHQRLDGIEASLRRETPRSPDA
ncbi:MAG: hypothetical protein LC739_08905 [Actinobacteria bacterium]|nr:hypothetical protein [Actinomycetota bacterium]